MAQRRHRARGRRPSAGTHLATVLVLAAAGLTAAGQADPDVPQGYAMPPPADPYGVDGGTVPLGATPAAPVQPPAVAAPRPVAPPDPARPDPVTPAATMPGSAGIPGMVLAAYQRAATDVGARTPRCRLPVELLAAIGKVESGHARGGLVDASGTALSPILGPMLNGGGFAAIADTDGGRYDGNATWDRAVGPMQFIPSTWRHWAADGNADGTADPENVFDASLAAADYLCAGGRDLSTPAGLDSAILSYNHSAAYLHLVRSWMAAYAGAASATPDIRQVAATLPADEPPSPDAEDPDTTAPAKPAPPTAPGKTDEPGPTVPPSPGNPPTSSTPTTRPSLPTAPSVPAGPSSPSGAGPLQPVLDPVTGLLTCTVTVVGGLLGGLLGGGATQPDCTECTAEENGDGEVCQG